MFVFRAVFIVATIFVAFVAQVSAVPPLTRFMLDAIPEGSDNSTDPDVAASGSDTSTSASIEADVPVAVGSSPVEVESAMESSAESSDASPSAADLAASSAVPAPSSSANAPVSQINAAGHIGVVCSTSVLIGSVVVGIVFAV